MLDGVVEERPVEQAREPRLGRDSRGVRYDDGIAGPSVKRRRIERLVRGTGKDGTPLEVELQRRIHRSREVEQTVAGLVLGGGQSKHREHEEARGVKACSQASG